MIIVIILCSIAIGFGFGFSLGYDANERKFQNIMDEVGISIITRIEGDRVTHSYMIDKVDKES